MKTRPRLPVPDPAESIILSSRPAFEYVKNQDGLWLPDISHVATEFEADHLEPEDELRVTDFRRCPDEAKFPKLPRDVDEQAEEIAEWIFETYFQLVSTRIAAYNRWRKMVNRSDFSDSYQNENYRLACRLLTEQILRRDLPFLPHFNLEYPFTVLPIFSIRIELETGPEPDLDEPNPDPIWYLYETVLKMTMSATVEVRQRNGEEELKQFSASFDSRAKAAMEQPSWSSSSSSLSSYSSRFDPNL